MQQVILSNRTRTVKTVIDIPAVVVATNIEAPMGITPAIGIEGTLNNSQGRIPDIINIIIAKDIRIRVIDVRALEAMSTKIIINNIIIKVIIEATSRTPIETSIEGEVDK